MANDVRPEIIKLADWVEFLEFSVEFDLLLDNGTWQFENMLSPDERSPYSLRAVLVPNKANFRQWQKKSPT